MKKHGWILFDTEKGGGYVLESFYGGGTPQDAKVFSSRERARKIKLISDRVLKVTLDTTGKPCAVIGRG